jgi:hypothetical protein
MDHATVQEMWWPHGESLTDFSSETIHNQTPWELPEEHGPSKVFAYRHQGDEQLVYFTEVKVGYWEFFRADGEDDYS